MLGALLLALVAWSRSAGPGVGRRSVFVVSEAESESGLAERLAGEGAVRSPRLFGLYLRLLGPGVAPGPHLVRDDLSPRELAQRLGRTPGRPTARVTLPEGWSSVQIGRRLEELEVTSLEDFRSAVFDAELARELGAGGTSAEGYLFPATYELSLDSDGASVVRTLVKEAKKRLGRLLAAHPEAVRRLASEHGFGEREIVTLASIVERETRDPEELPLIAGVFMNRLSDPTFRPARTLQSDPTAAYGCLVAPAGAPSCAGFTGAVTPAMLRDAQNRYNTYRHAGLPPGPIGNPGEQALGAVLAPARTDYLYFVASGRGRHAFSRSFEEHREAIESARPAPRPGAEGSRLSSSPGQR